MNLQYTQAITKQLSVGTELDGYMKVAAYGLTWLARYDTERWAFGATYRKDSVGQLSFARKFGKCTASGQVSFHKVQNKPVESEALFGVEYNYMASSFKGSVDSNGTLRSIFEERFGDIMTIVVCNELSIPEKQFRLGFGFVIQL
jgi:hypothetical protein